MSRRWTINDEAVFVPTDKADADLSGRRCRIVFVTHGRVGRRYDIEVEGGFRVASVFGHELEPVSALEAMKEAVDVGSG